MKASLKVFFENPFWVGVFERIEDGKLSVCKVTFGAEPKDRQSQKKKPECEKAAGEHGYRDEISAGSSKTAGRNEKGAQTDQPGRTGDGGAA